MYAKNVDLHPHCVGNGCFDDADAKKKEINTPSPDMPPNISINILLCIMSDFSSQPGAEWGEYEILGLLSPNNAIGPPNHILIRDGVIGEGVVRPAFVELKNEHTGAI